MLIFLDVLDIQNKIVKEQYPFKIVKSPDHKKSIVSKVSNETGTVITKNSVVSKVSDQTGTAVTQDIIQLIQKARRLQQEKICDKSKKKMVPVEGRLYQIKQSSGKFKLKDVITMRGNTSQVCLIF